MMEAGLLLDLHGDIVYEHTPKDRSSVALPDSRGFWDIIWEHREILSGFAHSHPGGGTPQPSGTDITTFAAIEAGLGVRLDWWIISEDETVFIRWVGPKSYNYRALPVRQIQPWERHLAKLSGYHQYPRDPEGCLLGEENVT